MYGSTGTQAEPEGGFGLLGPVTETEMWEVTLDFHAVPTGETDAGAACRAGK